ncbi:MAG: YggS family pyridoxal phosphate-dependent enzyme, partial [Firmicutes bacterium]|nr:YggS family pyridoxal phosphate-dependent enzyme [Bacillota bacterium]
MGIKENLETVRKNIKAAAQRSGRNPEDILLLAVSKTIDAETIKEALACDVSDLGENRVQEIMEKYDVLGGNIRWHLIGHLQTNKVKYIIDKVCLIHSVESKKLAEEINKKAA